MPVRLIPLSKLPKGTRNRISKVKLTPEWKEAMATLPNLKKGSAMMVEFSAATLKLGKTTAQRFKRLLIRDLSLKGLKDLNTFFRGKDEKGHPVLYITKK
jgi:hypothetical protein